MTDPMGCRIQVDNPTLNLDDSTNHHLRVSNETCVGSTPMSIHGNYLKHSANIHMSSCMGITSHLIFSHFVPHILKLGDVRSGLTSGRDKM